MLGKNYKDYIKSILISLGLLSIVYFYMLCNFWWGNHDWGYLKSGASIQSGLFEARYSQHLFTILFLDGHILPIFAFLSGFICIAIKSILIGKYFELPSKYWTIIALFIGINPHIYALFYYVYLFFPFMVWSLFGVGLLFLFEGKIKWWKLCLAILGFVLVFGSYPPNLAFIFVLFIGKRILFYVEGKEKFKDVFVRMIVFLVQILIAGFVYKILYNYLLGANLINTDMYNIKTNSLVDIIINLPVEFLSSITQLFYGFSFMGLNYIIPLSLIVFLGVMSVLLNAKNKYITILGLIVLFLASRFAFIVSSHSEFAIFRLMYWGRLGIYVFCLVVLFKEKKKWLKNALFVLLGFFFFKFSITNFEIQKNQNLGFVAGRLYQKRLLDTIISSKNYNEKDEYISLNFGQPNFREKFYSDKYNTGEMLGLNLVFEFDVANFLFWEETKSPIIIGAGISGNSILRVDRDGKEKWWDRQYWSDNPENMEKIRYWLYTEAEPYPSYKSVYVDDKYLILVLDKLVFYKYRELVATSLDK